MNTNLFNEPKITFTCVTYNRSKLLKNMIMSFVETNKYENFQWLFLHHDCKDDTEEFLNSLSTDKKYSMLKGKFKVLKGEQEPYLNELQSLGFDTKTPKKIGMAQFSYWRNKLTEHIDGDIWIDIPDDHQFIFEGNYCQDIIDVFNHMSPDGQTCNVGIMTFRTKFLYRLMKQNNKRSEVIMTPSGVEYYVIDSDKPHDEWNATSFKTFKDLGFYPKLEEEGKSIQTLWNEADPYYYYHHFQLNRKLREKDLKRVVLKVPVMHDCLDSKYEEKAKNDECIFPIFKSKEEIKSNFSSIDRPVSVEEYESLLK